MSRAGLSEFEALTQLIGDWDRGPTTLNEPNHSDCESFEFPSGQQLLVSPDSLSEEMQLGIYNDPYTLGWITALTSLSDLSASNGSPLGLLFSANWSDQTDHEKTMIFKGFKDCARAHDTHLVGGDQGTSEAAVLTSIALGASELPASRVGIQPGDLICSSDQMGFNAVFGFLHLFNKQKPDESVLHHTTAIKTMPKLRPLIRAAIDNSDGYLDTLCLLSQLNSDIQFEIKFEPTMFKDGLKQVFEQNDWPMASYLFGGLGDYNILFALPEAELDAARRVLPGLGVLAQATENQGSNLLYGDRKIPIDLQFTARYDLKTTKDYVVAMEEVFEWCRKNCP